MAAGNTYLQAKLVIEGYGEIDSNISGTLDCSGNNQINKLSVEIKNADLQNYSLTRKRVNLFLNMGSQDSTPTFTGYITSVIPKANGVTLACHDPRILLQGGSGSRITFTDKHNYDGLSLAAFMFDYISEKININNVEKIGLGMLKDQNPITSLTGTRGSFSVYEIMKKIVQASIDDDSNFLEPLLYFIDMIEDGEISHITIKKDKSLDNVPSLIYSFGEGLEEYTYKRRISHNTGVYKGGEFIYTNRPMGVSVTEIVTGQELSRAELRNLARQQILLDNISKDEISIKVNKGYDIDMGAIVRLDVTEEDIKGNHRVTGKKITFGDSLMCNLMLGRKPITLAKFIQ